MLDCQISGEGKSGAENGTGEAVDPDGDELAAEAGAIEAIDC